MSILGDDLFSLPEYSEQEELLRLEPVPKRLDASFDNPVAQVILDLPQIQMDREFDYEIPEKFADLEIGSRVVVDVGTRKANGFVVGRSGETRYGSHLRQIKRVVSNVPVLSPQILELARQVGRRQIAPVSDSLRLAIPQRHARAEKEFFATAQCKRIKIEHPDPGAWEHYLGGHALIDHVGEGRAIRACVNLRASDGYLDLVLPALQSVIAGGKRAIVVVPTTLMATACASAVREQLGCSVATFDSRDDHETRYSSFLKAAFGRADVVVGTRSAAWASVADLGLIAIIDDQHSALREPRSPYIHVREVAKLRSDIEECAFVSLGYGPSLELAGYAGEWAKEVRPAEPAGKSTTPQIVAAADYANEGGELSRMPSSVFKVIREGLTHGHVLVVVPKAGYINGVACAKCRDFVECSECAGPMAIPGPDRSPQCGRCGHEIREFVCSRCHSRELRPIRIGSQRTAQEIGRAFRGVPIHLSGGSGMVDADEHSIVIATPGSEPRADGGYSASVILDAGYILRSGGDRAEQYFLRNIAHVARLVRPRSDAGRVLIVGDVPDRLVKVASAWSFHAWAVHDMAERRELDIAPAAGWIQVSGSRDALREFVGLVHGIGQATEPENEDRGVMPALGLGIDELLPGLAVIGPVPAREHDEVLYLRFAEEQREARTELINRAYRELAVRGAHHVRIKVDASM